MKPDRHRERRLLRHLPRLGPLLRDLIYKLGPLLLLLQPLRLPFQAGEMTIQQVVSLAHLDAPLLGLPLFPLHREKPGLQLVILAFQAFIPLSDLLQLAVEGILQSLRPGGQ
ncbi:hypothetical protein LIER_18225 [Lithospermum erythrorhizon]|uniref:Uncharacterized protein n=1 Tax=Lithospermum erythrorhizon TaxID=34254 RepID=A0AAV3QEH3_LITER